MKHWGFVVFCVFLLSSLCVFIIGYSSGFILAYYMADTPPSDEDYEGIRLRGVSTDMWITGDQLCFMEKDTFNVLDGGCISYNEERRNTHLIVLSGENE